MENNELLEQVSAKARLWIGEAQRERLHDAQLADRDGKLVERRLVEGAAGLLRIRGYPVYLYLGDRRTPECSTLRPSTAS